MEHGNKPVLMQKGKTVAIVTDNQIYVSAIAFTTPFSVAPTVVATMAKADTDGIYGDTYGNLYNVIQGEVFNILPGGFSYRIKTSLSCAGSIEINWIAWA